MARESTDSGSPAGGDRDALACGGRGVTGSSGFAPLPDRRPRDRWSLWRPDVADVWTAEGCHTAVSL